MKKLYTFAFSLLVGFGAYAQCAPNTSYTNPGIYPPAGSSVKQDSIYVLPGASWGVGYSETVNIVVPVDTTVTYGTLTVTADIDSMRVVGMNNVPAWMSVSFNNASGSWAGGERGCVNFSGTVPSSNGTWLIESELEVFANLGTLGQVSDTFSIWIEVTAGNAISIRETKWDVPVVGPNPMSSRLFITYPSTTSSPWAFELMDVTGRVVHRQNGQVSTGENRITVTRTNWPEGMYLYRFRVGSKTHTGRLIVRDGL